MVGLTSIWQFMRIFNLITYRCNGGGSRLSLNHNLLIPYTRDFKLICLPPLRRETSEKVGLMI